MLSLIIPRNIFPNIIHDLFIASMKCLVCPMKHAAILLNLDSTHVCVPLDDESDLNIVASYDRTGTYIYVGNAKGRVS